MAHVMQPIQFCTYDPWKISKNIARETVHVLGCILVLGIVLCLDDRMKSVNVRVSRSVRKAQLAFVCNKVIINVTGLCEQCANLWHIVLIGMRRSFV